MCENIAWFFDEIITLNNHATMAMQSVWRKKNQVKQISGKVINLTTTYIPGKYYFWFPLTSNKISRDENIVKSINSHLTVKWIKSGSFSNLNDKLKMKGKLKPFVLWKV